MLFTEKELRCKKEFKLARIRLYLFKKLNLRPSKQEFLTITETTQQGDRADPNDSKKESADERRLGYEEESCVYSFCYFSLLVPSLDLSCSNLSLLP